MWVFACNVERGVNSSIQLTTIVFSEIFPEFSSQVPRRPKQFEDDVEGTDEDGGDESADQVRVPFLA